MSIHPRAPEDRLEKLFPPDIDQPDLGTFHLGLVLGGTASAGCWTAGALDFLLEALDAWQRHKAPDQAAPPHRVIIKAAAGSSGGAVNSAILGLLTTRPFTHIHTDPTPDATLVDSKVNPSGNPLWDVWVNGFHIDRMLSSSDIDAKLDLDKTEDNRAHTAQHVPSLLNATIIDEEAQKLDALAQDHSKYLHRPYFAAPFRIAITVTNVRGVPFDIQAVPMITGVPSEPAMLAGPPWHGAVYLQHDDYACFAFPNGSSGSNLDPVVGKREDEFWLLDDREFRSHRATHEDPTDGYAPYSTLVAYATASGAEPLGLAARSLSRPAEQYWYRPRVRPCLTAPGYAIDWPNPDWLQIEGVPATGIYNFTAVDGGTLNNDPVSLLHRSLAGLVGRNPRGPEDAFRAMLMIDPLADAPRQIPSVGRSLVAIAGRIINTFVNGARYLTADMELFADRTVCSRFQIVPNRPHPLSRDLEKTLIGQNALATATFGALGGWTARAFRVHDYLLGRHNMQSYIAHKLTLSASNRLFDGWSDEDRIKFAQDRDGDPIKVTIGMDREHYYLPIVPDVTNIKVPVADWPAKAFDPDSIAAPAKARLRLILQQLITDNFDPGVKTWIVRQIAVPFILTYLVNKLLRILKAELTAANLL